MNLPKIEDFDFKNKRVLVRCDLDVPLKDGKVENDTRIRECLPTIEYLLKQGAKVILLGHLGRPEGKIVEEFKMLPVAQDLSSKFKVQSSKLQFKVENFETYQISENLILLENLRFYPGEENNDIEFTKELASLGDFYVNEAFATSHRAHASIVGLPKLLPCVAGFYFAKEVEGLSKAIENPQRPLVFIIGGAKLETKLAYIEKFAQKADTILIGGTLGKDRDRDRDRVENIFFADLSESGLDINHKSIIKFKEIIKEAGTIVLNGPMGKYEDPGAERGTEEVFKMVANSKAFKIAGGGDTIAALTRFNLIDKMDYVSTAGGAMLEFLAKGTLPGINALISK